MEEESDIVARLEQLDYQNMLRAGDGGRLKERTADSLAGDPCDKSLSDYELNVVIAQRALETAKLDICGDLRRELDECLEKNCAGLLGKLSMGLRAGLNCSAEELNNCYRTQFYNPRLHMRVRDEYLNERSHYRNTGITTSRIHHGRFVTRSEADGPALDADGHYRPRKPECWDEMYGGENPAWASYQYKSS